MSWLRKGPVLAAAAGLLVVWALVFFLFDPLLKRALISAGQGAAGAKVEIASLHSRWARGSLELGGVAVADREQPMKNVVELSRAAFRLDVPAALRGKAVVREAALEGLRLGTPRRTSGELRRAPPSALALAVRRQIAPARESALSKLGDVQSNAVVAVDAAKLQGLKKLEEAKTKAKEIEGRWTGKSEETKAIEREAREIADHLKSLGGGGNVFGKLQASTQAQSRLRALISRVEAQKAQAQRDVAQAQALMTEAEELRKKDLGGLLASAGLPTLDSQDLARRLMGAQTAARLSTALGWMRTAREKAAARKASAPPAPPRRKGVDVEFPRAHAYPQFLLEGAKITGTLDGVLGGALDLRGLLDGVTSNPKLYGKPATLALAGASGSGPAASLNARLDQQRDPVGVSLDFEGSGFSLAGSSLGDGEVGATLRDGRARVKGRLASSGEEWTGEVLVEASGVALEPKVALSGPAGALVSDALKSLSGFRARVGISGREDDLKLSFSSDAGDAVAAAMKKALSGQLEARKKALEAKLAAAYGDKAKDARASVDGLTAKLMAPLDAQKAALDKQLQEAVGKAVGGGLNRLFRR